MHCFAEKETAEHLSLSWTPHPFEISFSEYTAPHSMKTTAGQNPIPVVRNAVMKCIQTEITIVDYLYLWYSSRILNKVLLELVESTGSVLHLSFCKPTFKTKTTKWHRELDHAVLVGSH